MKTNEEENFKVVTQKDKEQTLAWGRAPAPAAPPPSPRSVQQPLLSNSQHILRSPLLPLRVPRWLSSKESACNAGDTGSIPGMGRSPGEGNGYTHSSILAWRIPTGRGAWRAPSFPVGDASITRMIWLAFDGHTTPDHIPTHCPHEKRH